MYTYVDGSMQYFIGASIRQDDPSLRLTHHKSWLWLRKRGAVQELAATVD